MQKIEFKDIIPLFENVAEIFKDKKDELCEMDANMGDGDLGLTMSKGFGALPVLIRENETEKDIGKTLFKAAMKMAGVVPSTMGTLMSSGLMEGAKVLNGKEYIDAKAFAEFLKGFERGVKKRGKCEEGDRTLLDSIAEAAGEAFEVLEGNDLEKVAEAALEGARIGVKKTEDMLPKYGKAAVFSAKAKGIPDQGAVAGMYLIKGMAEFITK